MLMLLLGMLKIEQQSNRTAEVRREEKMGSQLRSEPLNSNLCDGGVSNSRESRGRSW